MGRRRVWRAFSTVSDPTRCGWLGSEPKQEIGPGLPSRLQRSCRQQEHQRLSRTIIPCQVAPGACSAGSRCVFQRGLSTLLDAAQGAVALRHVDFSHVAQNRTSSVGCYSGNVGRTSTGCRIQLGRMAGVSRFFVPESVRHKMTFRAPTDGSTSATDRWVPVGAIIVFSATLVPYLWAQRTPIERAVERNPGNGWLVSRLIMKTSRADKREFHDRDFLNQPNRSDGPLVLASRALRNFREQRETTDASWDIYECLEEEAERYAR